MMKRIMACVLALACLLMATALAEGLSMQVVNVKNSVNLRQQPSTDSASLGMVPVGTVVTDCSKVEGSDWYAVTYEGVSGYIRGDKLQVVEQPKQEEPAAEPAPAESEPQQPAAPVAAEGEPLVPADEQKAEEPVAILDKKVKDAPIESIDAPTEYDDDFKILDETVGNVRVIGRQIYQENQEYLMAVGLDANGNELWKRETATHNITELMQTDIFIGGTADSPLVLIYNASTGKGLTAVDPATGDIVWEVPRDTVFLGGSISHVVDGNGTLYVGGYYGPDPVAIDVNGNVLWQADSGSEEATWMYRMELTADGISCLYGSMAGDNTGTIVYGFDGQIKDIIYE